MNTGKRSWYEANWIKWGHFSSAQSPPRTSWLLSFKVLVAKTLRKYEQILRDKKFTVIFDGMSSIPRNVQSVNCFDKVRDWNRQTPTGEMTTRTTSKFVSPSSSTTGNCLRIVTMATCSSLWARIWYHLNSGSIWTTSKIYQASPYSTRITSTPCKKPHAADFVLIITALFHHVMDL